MKHWKPFRSPLAVLSFLAYLAPAAVAVVGDSFHDLEMGRRAGAGLRIGVLSGASGHADLAPAAECFDAFGGDCQDQHGHGTHVGGIVGATTDSGTVRKCPTSIYAP